MIAIVPVSLGPPFVFVFVPPAVPVIPAMLARLVQIVTRPIRLFALHTVMFNRLMQAVIRPPDTALAIVIFRSQLRNGAECQEPGNHARGDCGFGHQLSSGKMSHTPPGSSIRVQPDVASRPQPVHLQLEA